ncbi:hypothetical protein ACWOC1_02800 [Enterococcus quebecensis]|uniref:WxL domain-containing protein n=1 Tax=Enterococcus quebecensis TaxID=903983 RepID=A0A1E5GRJ0_9ENTE|nr:hypothetical protein [Enterococcus quebecensis]OEG15289.1 hypothetical protein BCR23_10675 [Enterococcus quebecensis]OJG74874.1 hypothetical protein RV12_GL002291 [Enterococcus quebecensis]
MKTKHILSTAAVFVGLISGAVLTTQTANAQTSTSAVTQKASDSLVEISSVQYVHYNVLRAKLKTPVSATKYYLALGAEDLFPKATAVVQNGKYIGFDFKLDDLVKKYPTVADREQLFDSLYIHRFTLSVNVPPVATKFTNQDLKNELLNHHFLGNVLANGNVGTISNVIEGSSFNNFFNKKEVAGDHLLEDGSITTQTSGIQFDFKSEMNNGYTYTLTDSSGKVAGKVSPFMEYLFVNSPKGKNFLAKEYTVTAKSKKTGEVSILAKFTPINIF